MTAPSEVIASQPDGGSAQSAAQSAVVLGGAAHPVAADRHAAADGQLEQRAHVTVEAVGVGVATDAAPVTAVGVLVEGPVAPLRGQVGATRGVVGDPQRVVRQRRRLHVVLPEVAAGVDDRLDAGRGLDVRDPLLHLVRDRRRRLAAVVLDVDHRRQITRLQIAHVIEQQVRLRDRILRGAEELVDADLEPGRARVRPVLVEVVVEGVEAVRDANEREAGPVTRDGVPVHVALPLRDVDALERRPARADRGGLGIELACERRGGRLVVPQPVAHLRVRCGDEVGGRGSGGEGEGGNREGRDRQRPLGPGPGQHLRSSSLPHPCTHLTSSRAVAQSQVT